MEVKEDVVRLVADLAKLKVDDADVQEYARSMTRILDLVEEMQDLDTANVEPMANPLDAVQRLRADKVTEEDQHQRYQQTAPETERALYLVPRVVE